METETTEVMGKVSLPVDVLSYHGDVAEAIVDHLKDIGRVPEDAMVQSMDIHMQAGDLVTVDNIEVVL